MLKFISDLLGATINSWILFYGVFKFSNKKMNYKSKKMWIFLISYALYMIIAYKITDNFIRILINYLILVLCNFLLIRGNIVKIMLNTLLSVFILSLSEFIYVGSVVYFLNIDIQHSKQLFLSLSLNFSTVMIAYCITNIVVSRKIFKEIINKRQEKNNKMIILLFVMTCITISILMYTIYFDLPSCPPRHPHRRSSRQARCGRSPPHSSA